MTFVAPDACPISWAPPRAGTPGDTADGTVSVLVGGDFAALGSAAGAEGVVVTRGHATFALETPGTYRVGVTATGSQVAPHEGSDMLTVGGDLAVLPSTVLDVGKGRAGDVVVGGVVSHGGGTELNGGQLDRGFPEAVAPYGPLLGALAPKSVAFAAHAPTGQVTVTDTAITLTGDGTSDPQVFTVDGATLGALAGVGRSLQVLGVPTGASAVVNLTGPAVDLDVDSLLAADGTVMDPSADPAFVELATHLLWNAPGAATVDVGGLAQLPGTLLVPTAPSTTTLAGAGTNGRVLVAGDLVHTGSGTLHSYPFLADDDLSCGPELAHLGTLKLDVELADPDKVVADDRFFQGTFSCELDGKDVTPRDAQWSMRATADERVLSDKIPVGAVCTVSERLEVAPANGYEWADPVFDPAKVKVAKRDPRGTTLTNRARALPEPPEPPETRDPTPPVETEPPVTEPPAPEETEAPPPPTTTTAPEPTEDPELVEPTTLPSPEPTPASTADADPAEPQADAPRPGSGPAGPLTTTAPFTLRGGFVWGPLIMLSLLTLVVRIKRRPKRPARLH